MQDFVLVRLKIKLIDNWSKKCSENKKIYQNGVHKNFWRILLIEYIWNCNRSKMPLTRKNMQNKWNLLNVIVIRLLFSANGHMEMIFPVIIIGLINWSYSSLRNSPIFSIYVCVYFEWILFKKKNRTIYVLEQIFSFFIFAIRFIRSNGLFHRIPEELRKMSRKISKAKSIVT